MAPLGIPDFKGYDAMSSQDALPNSDTRILIVEDSRTQAFQLQHILERHDYHVSVAQSGQEALAAIKRSVPNIVISDIVMPEMDGYELCRRIKADADSQDVPVILLTQLADPKDIIRGLECGADNFITKPYKEEFLLSRMQYILANRRLRGDTVSRMGVEIFFGGEKYVITSDRMQVLHLLLSTYETTVQKNLELEAAKEAVQQMNRKIELLHEVALRLGECETEDEVYRLSTEAAEQIVSFSAYVLSILQDDRLSPKATSAGLPADAIEEGCLVVDLARKTLETGKTRVFGRSDGTAGGESFESGISAPVGNIGVFQIVASEPDAFGDEDARLLELLLRHTAGEARRIRLQNELKEQAIRDPLTGVYNRNYLDQALEQEGRRSERYGHTVVILMIDIDRFKEINDQFGHQKGDEVLQAVSSLLLGELRGSDILVRHGGDEFLAMLPETEREGGEAARQRILDEVVRRNERSDWFDFPVTLSIGSAYWSPGEKRSVEDALVEADQQMYEHKGRQRETDHPG